MFIRWFPWSVCVPCVDFFCFGPIAAFIVDALLVAVVGADLNETLVLVGWLGNPSIGDHTL